MPAGSHCSECKLEEPGVGVRASDKRESLVCTYCLAAMPPNCVAFVAVVALVALVAFVAVSADEALALRIAYGVEVTCWRGVSKVNEPPVGRALISRNRFAPVKAFVPKSRLTVKTPLLTATVLMVCVEPICAPPDKLSNSPNCKS